ncbi:MAG: hypothetical protein ACK5PT_06310 [Cereibacter sp.]
MQPVHGPPDCTGAGLVAFRLIRGGVAGSGLARFARVVAGPGAMLACLGTMLRGGEGRCPGHNPAGAVMILALLLTHPGTACRGWLMADPAPAARLPALPQVLVAPA